MDWVIAGVLTCPTLAQDASAASEWGTPVTVAGVVGGVITMAIKLIQEEVKNSRERQRIIEERAAAREAADRAQAAEDRKMFQETMRMVVEHCEKEADVARQDRDKLLDRLSGAYVPIHPPVKGGTPP